MGKDELIRVGDSVIIRRDNTYKHVKITAGKQQRVGSGLHVPLQQLIGYPYGSAFQVVGGNLKQINPSLVENSGDEVLGNAGDGDNREIVDNCQSQKLDRDDIQNLKESGESGENIVAKLVENSSTFQERSNFSKAKYLRKKSKKHIPQFVAEYPSARLICQLLSNEQYPKAMGLQPHTLAQILVWANVRSGSKVLVFESTQSFIAGAVMERLGNKGHVVQLYPGAYPVRTLLEDFNHSNEVREQVLHGFPLEKLIFLEDDPVPVRNASEEEAKVKIEEINPKAEISNEVTAKEVYTSLASHSDDASNPTDVTELPCKKRKLEENLQKEIFVSPHLMKQRELKAKEEQCALQLLKEKKFDSLIIVSKYNPKDCILTLLKYLPPSRPFVIYCQHKEPLMECYVHLRASGSAIDVVISSTWFRKIQALPGRTHPEVTSPGVSGYILRGMTIEPSVANDSSDPIKK